jgi:hypothetical protein
LLNIYKHISMIDRTNVAEIVWWILFLGMAFDCNIHWMYLIPPGIITVLSFLLNYNNKTNNND